MLDAIMCILYKQYNNIIYLYIESIEKITFSECKEYIFCIQKIKVNRTYLIEV